MWERMSRQARDWLRSSKTDSQHNKSRVTKERDTKDANPTKPGPGRCWPEVNKVDHVIQAYRGATIASSAMRSQVQAAKEYKPETIYERLRRLEIQLDQHQQENQFYGVFFDLYKELHAIVIGVSQNLILQSYFEPESIPARDPFIYDAIRQLNAALTHAKAAEVQAEANWKTYWNISPTADVPTSWI